LVADAVARAKAIAAEARVTTSLVHDWLATRQYLSGMLKLEQSSLTALSKGDATGLVDAAKGIPTLQQRLDHLNGMVGAITLSDTPISTAGKSAQDAYDNDIRGVVAEYRKSSLLVDDLVVKLHAQLPRSLFP
jgi:hypothetical protein